MIHPPPAETRNVTSCGVFEKRTKGKGKKKGVSTVG